MQMSDSLDPKSQDREGGKDIYLAWKIMTWVSKVKQGTMYHHLDS